MPPPMRFCVNCKHVEVNQVSPAESLCNHPEVVIRNLVSGEPMATACSSARLNQCGAGAKFFEKAESE